MMYALLAAHAQDPGDGLEVVTSAPPVGYELVRSEPPAGVHVLAAVREFEPFALQVEPGLWSVSSDEDALQVLAELLPATGLELSLATLVSTEEAEGIWRFEQQLEGASIVGAGVAVVTEDGSVRRVEGALFLDRGPANSPQLELGDVEQRAIEAVQGGEVAAVLPFVLPTGSDLRHTWFVQVETGRGRYEVALDAETGEVLQLFGQRPPFGIIVGNGPAAPEPGVRLTGAALVGGRLVRP